jgi:hypothetical protein
MLSARPLVTRPIIGDLRSVGTRFVSRPLKWRAELFHGGGMANRNVVAIGTSAGDLKALRFLAKGFD